MGGKSKSSTSTALTQNTTNTQDIQTTTIGLDSVDTGVVGSNNTVSKTVYNTETDQGAVAGAFDFASNAAKYAGESLHDSLDAANESLSTAADLGGKALDTGSKALTGAYGFGESALDFAGNVVKSSLDSQSAAASKTADTLAGAITAAGNATRSDTANTLTTVSKYGAIALAVVVVVIGGVLIYSGRKK